MQRIFCDFIFKGVECGYKGASEECDKTLKRCRGLGRKPEWFMGSDDRGRAWKGTEFRFK